MYKPLTPLAAKLKAEVSPEGRLEVVRLVGQAGKVPHLACPQENAGYHQTVIIDAVGRR
jgi:hypothetical protein